MNVVLSSPLPAMFQAWGYIFMPIMTCYLIYRIFHASPFGRHRHEGFSPDAVAHAKTIRQTLWKERK